MIYLLSTDTLETMQIPNDPKCLGQGQPAFSHSGQYLAFWCFRSPNEHSLYSLKLAQGKFNVISAILGFPFGLTWSADDKKLIFEIHAVTEPGMFPNSIISIVIDGKLYLIG